MTSIPVAICRLSDKKFKRFYLRKEWVILDFSLNFRNVQKNLEHCEEKEEYPSLIITEIIASERDVYLSV